MTYGYARISTPQQNIDRQIRNLKDFSNDIVVFQESYTGTKQERPEWLKLSRKIKSGDTIVVDSVSRMSRNADDGYKEYEKLYKMGINLIFLKERHIDTYTYRNAINEQISTTGNEIADTYIEATNKVLMILAKQQIKLAFEQAQKEVDDLHKRTSEGMLTARQNGKQIGRQAGITITTQKSVDAKKIILKHSTDFGGSLSDVDVMKMIGDISRNTYYKYKKELKLSTNALI